MLTETSMLTVILTLISVAMTVILFLVGRLLAANKDAVDALRIAMRDQSEHNLQGFRDVFDCLDSLRNQLGCVDRRVARMEGVESAQQQKAVVHG